jgi:hypothetical protein
VAPALVVYILGVVVGCMLVVVGFMLGIGDMPGGGVQIFLAKIWSQLVLFFLNAVRCSGGRRRRR